jgi:signal transduction histidine kinase
MRAVQEQVRTRQSILIALGHELKSPLQALLSKTPEDSPSRKYIDRMSRAVETLDLATSIEAAFENGKIVVSSTDLARFLSTLASNMVEQGVAVSYQGPATNVITVFDPIALDTALSHLINNAQRYQVAGTEILISLTRHGVFAQIEVFNYGPPIPEDQIDAIFNLGVTERSQDTNRGEGLFVTRAYIVGMKGSIRAENREGGVAFVTTLPMA